MGGRDQQRVNSYRNFPRHNSDLALAWTVEIDLS